jgi:hypothetical protein
MNTFPNNWLYFIEPERKAMTTVCHYGVVFFIIYLWPNQHCVGYILCKIGECVLDPVMWCGRSLKCAKFL